MPAMRKKSTSFFLILLLTLLQCVAPLLHAHAMGTQASGGVHVHDDFDWTGKTGHQTGFAEIGAVSSTDAPAISVAKERKQEGSIAVADPSGVVPRQTVELAQPTGQSQSALPPLPFHRSPHFLLPLPQAPPAVA